jgi:hypothetical protein
MAKIVLDYKTHVKGKTGVKFKLDFPVHLCYNSSAMKRVVSILALLLSFALTSATCSRKTGDSTHREFPETLIPDGLGVNVHFPGAPKEDMDLIKEADIRFIRADLTWSQVEREKGRYDFDRYDELVESFGSQGGRVLFILDYGNRLYGQGRAIKTDTQRKGFADFAAAAADHYKGKGIIWEIWNEPNIQRFWGEEPNADDYMALVKEACRAIREVDENALIIAPSVCGFDGGFIRECGKRGLFELVDGISYHPYREGGPESVVRSHEKLREIIEKFTPPGNIQPVIISSEWGWGLSYMTEEIGGEVDPPMRQAAYLTRRFVLEAYAGAACAIHYKWRENNHGLIRANHEPKPSYTAFKVLNEQLTGYCRSISRLEIGDPDSVFVLLFEGPSGKRMVAWCVGSKRAVSIPFGTAKAEGVDFLGTPMVFKGKDRMLTLTITEKPIFIHVDE